MDSLYCKRIAYTRGRGQPCLNLSSVQLSLGRMTNTVYVHSGKIRKKESVQSCTVRRKTFANQCLYPEKVSLKDLTKIIRLADPLLQSTYTASTHPLNRKQRRRPILYSMYLGYSVPDSVPGIDSSPHSGT